MENKQDEIILDKLDRLIINAIQDQFPTEPRPFEIISKSLNQQFNLNTTETDILSRVRKLKENGFIRRLGAIFDSRALGYYSTLFAAKVPTDKITEFSKIVNSNNYVTHNYVRDNPINIWFTFCYENPNQLVQFLENLKMQSGILDIFEVSSKKLYKIRAVFSLDR
jgi:DNA-binding Lrp family transcriptional regulator